MCPDIISLTLAILNAYIRPVLPITTAHGHVRVSLTLHFLSHSVVLVCQGRAWEPTIAIAGPFANLLWTISVNSVGSITMTVALVHAALTSFIQVWNPTFTRWPRIWGEPVGKRHEIWAYPFTKFHALVHRNQHWSVFFATSCQSCHLSSAWFTHPFVPGHPPNFIPTSHFTSFRETDDVAGEFQCSS